MKDITEYSKEELLKIIDILSHNIWGNNNNDCPYPIAKVCPCPECHKCWQQYYIEEYEKSKLEHEPKI